MSAHELDGDLRVAIDMTLAVVGITGVQRYAAIVHEQLCEWPGIAVHSFAAGRGGGGADIPIRHRYRVPLRVLHALWRTVQQPRAELLAGGADVVHGLGGLPPPTRKPLVLTVHDLLPLTEPGFFTERGRAESAGLARALDRTAVVVTTCSATATEITRLTGFPSDRVVVAPPGARERKASPAAAPVEGPYLVALGAVTPRKGLAELAEAVALLGPGCPPVLVAGPDGFFADEVKAAVARHDVHHKFRFLGPVDDDAVAGLLAGATVVCHPSLAEGFGIVCLEAMAQGAAVVAVDLPSIREMGEGAVSIVPARDPTAFADALQRLLDDPSERARLGALAAARAASYTWSNMVSGIVDSYRLAVAKS